MAIKTQQTVTLLWYDIIKEAEDCCSIALDAHLEAYLVTLLGRYLNQPELASAVMATAFLKAAQQDMNARMEALREVGDQCLLFAGLFPKIADKRQIKINYFVQLGQSAYSTISTQINDLYASLSMHFVPLMDVLQSIHPTPLTPLEAYEQWNSLKSKRALKILNEYTHAKPISTFRLS